MIRTINKWTDVPLICKKNLKRRTFGPITTFRTSSIICLKRRTENVCRKIALVANVICLWKPTLNKVSCIFLVSCILF